MTKKQLILTPVFLCCIAIINHKYDFIPQWYLDLYHEDLCFYLSIFIINIFITLFKNIDKITEYSLILGLIELFKLSVLEWEKNK